YYQGGWQPWRSLGGYYLAKPAAVSWGVNRIDVVGLGGDDAIWHTYWNGTVWVGGDRLGWQAPGQPFTGGPAIASPGPGQLAIFARRTSARDLYRKLYPADASVWNRDAWAPFSSTFTGSFTADPAAVSWGADRVDVFGRGLDNAIWHGYGSPSQS